MNNNNEEKRNANVRQDRNRAAKQGHQRFDDMGLTKRNAEYMFKFNQALNATKLNDDQKATTISTMLDELKEGQKAGKTARNMWGTVEQKVQNTVNPPQKSVGVTGANYWPNAAYNALMFFMIFTLLYGITSMMAKNPNTNTTMGITGIVLSSLVAGATIPFVSNVFDPKVKHRYSGWVRILMLLGLFLVWMVIFFGAAVIPRVINPIMNPITDIVMGVIAAAGMWLLKQRYEISSTIF